MRFNVVSLGFALAAPIMAAQVGFRPGQQDQPLQEWDNAPTSVAGATTPAAAISTPAKNQGFSEHGGSHQSTQAAAQFTPAAQPTIPAVQPSQGGISAQQPTTAAVQPSQGGISAQQTSEVGVGSQHTSEAGTGSHHSSAVGVESQQSSGAGIGIEPTSAAGIGSPTTAAKASATPTSGGGSSTGVTGSGGSAPKGGQLLYIVNKYGKTVNLVTGNSGGPQPTGGKDSLASGETATITLQSGWAGRFAVNPTGVPSGNQDGTKIEGAITSSPFWDISLVDGFTVPITCTCGSDTTPFIGCNVDLYKQSAKCPQPNGDSLCLNPARSLNNGPANSWFAACKDAAYTYPQNDIATQTCSGDKMTCCVGSACAAGKNQGKRSINPVYARWAFPRSAFAEKN